MRRRTGQRFETVRTEGGLLPAELLERIAGEDGAIPGLRSEDYRLLPHERLADGAERAWSYLQGAWKSFRDGLEKLPPGDHATRLTRERWLFVLFRELGYGHVPAARGVEIGGKGYALSHLWENRVPIHLLGCRLPLDRRTPGVPGAARSSPHGLVQELLNRSDDHLWGFVSNGTTLRLLRDHHSLTRQAYVEFDLEAIFEGELFAEFVLLWLVGHVSRVAGDRPEECWLEKWFQQSRSEGVRAPDQLRDGVERAIEALGRGFLRRRENRRLHAALESGELVTQVYYHQLLRLVYRLIFLFVAEDRGYLLDPAAGTAARERYERFYATARLRRLAERRRTSPYADLWHGLRLVMQKLDAGCSELALPGLDSYLWRNEAVSWLIDAELGNEDLLAAVFAMSHFMERGVRLPVAWKSLGAEELGSIYEALLELHPKIHREAAAFELGTAAGHERKTTGSYYTPASLVDCLLDTALDPVLEEAGKKDDPERAILDLKVCDPACGSGHFLVAAARRMARRLAAARSGDEEPSPHEYQQALRDVVGRCIYGVDVNPMAAELCKVSLWMEAIEPGKPLSFLDHRIQVGNSLLGAPPALLRKGIPDEAFTPIEGDDKAFCRELRKINAKDRTGQRRLFAPGGDPMSRFGDLATSLRQLDAIDDGTIEGIRRKETHWDELQDSAEYRYGRMWTDAWCAAFVWEKVDREDRPFPITEEFFRRMERDPRNTMPGQAEEVRRLARRYRFFHWHLAFPDVFQVPLDVKKAENQVTGWTGGFDIVVGNPPWERVKLQEKEFFSTRAPKIAGAKNAAARRKLITALPQTAPALWDEWATARRAAEAVSLLVRVSGIFPLCGKGDVNTYSLFAELNRSLIVGTGRTGFIAPAGLATDATTQYFFQDLVGHKAIVSLFHFENEEKIFSAVHNMFRFCLVTLVGSQKSVDEARFVAYARKAEHIAQPERLYTLTPRDIQRLNPNTATLPLFRCSRDADINRAIFGRIPILIDDGRQGANHWNVTFLRMFDMANASGAFRTRQELEVDDWACYPNRFVQGGQAYLPLYEAKMIHHFDHRFGTYEGQTQAQSNKGFLPYLTAEQHADPTFLLLPRYWIADVEVENRLAGRWKRGWLLGWRDICRSTDERTVIGCVIPRTGVGDKFLLMLPAVQPSLVPALLANLNSFVFDYIARQKVGGSSLKYFTMKQLPPLPPAVYSEEINWKGLIWADWLVPRVIELTYTAWDLQPFAQDCDYDGPPFRWDEERRQLLRAELDAAFFHLYGIERDDVDYIMETFPIVKRRDVKKFGDYRTKLLILHVYDAMQRAIETGEPYQTLLDPPPADPRVAHPPREGEPAVPSYRPQPSPPPPAPAAATTAPDEEIRTAAEETEDADAATEDPELYEAVLSWLDSHPGWHSRAEILAGVERATAQWNRVIGDLVATGEVERQGTRRGTRYRFRGANHQLVVAWLAAHPGWHSRAEILAGAELSPDDWGRTIDDVLAAGEVVKTGERRGTRYRHRGADRGVEHA